MRIEIAVDTKQAEEFAAWLIARGHDASVGRSTGNYVDGAWTGHDQEASEIMRGLWEGFCQS